MAKKSKKSKEPKEPHEVSEVICIRCGKRWISARPEGTLLKDIQCPNCGAGFVIETGQDLGVAE